MVSAFHFVLHGACQNVSAQHPPSLLPLLCTIRALLVARYSFLSEYRKASTWVTVRVGWSRGVCPISDAAVDEPINPLIDARKSVPRYMVILIYRRVNVYLDRTFYEVTTGLFASQVSFPDNIVNSIKLPPCNAYRLPHA